MVSQIKLHLHHLKSSFLKKILAKGLGFCLLLGFLTGCNHGLFHSRISEGTIEYKITVLDSANPLAKMAPEKMTVKFKNNKACAELIAGMGFFTTTFINDEPDRKLTQMVHLIDKKWYYTGDTSAINNELRHEAQYDVRDTSGTKVIAGYTCKKAIARSKNRQMPDVVLYYTNDIKLEQPNWATPFRGIDGVLLQYCISKYNFYMEFTADKVNPEKIDDSAFKVPSDYKLRTKKDMDDLIKGFQ